MPVGNTICTKNFFRDKRPGNEDIKTVMSNSFCVEYSSDSFPSFLDFKRCLLIVNGEKTLIALKGLQQTPFSLFGQPCVSNGHGKTSLQCRIRSDNVIKGKKIRVLRGTCKRTKVKNKVLTK